MTKPAPAVVALVLAGAVFGACPWDERERGAPLSRTASVRPPPAAVQGIDCPIDDR
ncbi:MAG TPA: hypothetical protein VEK73_19285 [Xanthobacteraceae bacterium]|nr:hypothetical protein [Xanthobacteraceae bacterium]